MKQHSSTRVRPYRVHSKHKTHVLPWPLLTIRTLTWAHHDYTYFVKLVGSLLT